MSAWAWGRLHVGKGYVYVDFSPYFGPSFFFDREMERPYAVSGQDDPIWPIFGEWLERVEAERAWQTHKGEKIPQTVESLQAIMERDAMMIERAHVEITELRKKLNQRDQQIDSLRRKLRRLVGRSGGEA